MKKLTRKELLQVNELIRSNSAKLIRNQDWNTIAEVVKKIDRLTDMIEYGYEENIPFEAYLNGNK